MANNYFQRVSKQTKTKFWINNPTREEAKRAIEEGALGCTQNPSYTEKMLFHPQESVYTRQVLEEVVKETKNDNEAARLFQRRLVKNTSDIFFPVYEESNQKDGYVSIQSDPFLNDTEAILADSHINSLINKNISCKVPCDKVGLTVIEDLVSEGISVNVTEVFTVSQVEATIDTYNKAVYKAKEAPVVFISHIAGIYDDYLQQYVQDNDVDISSDVLYQAGLAVARKVYQLMKDRNPELVFVGGGARGLHHFTEMVGGDVCITINWLGTADKLIESNPPVVSRIFNPVENRVIDELLEKLPPFKQGYLTDGLALEGFEDFGPVQLFKGGFKASWQKVVNASADIRSK